MAVAEKCREMGVSAAPYDKWPKYSGVGVPRLRGLTGWQRKIRLANNSGSTRAATSR